MNLDVFKHEEELMFSLCLVPLSNDLRGDAIHRHWLNWCMHVKSLKCQGLFWLYYRKSYGAFTSLLNLLQSDSEVIVIKSRNCISNQNPIGTEVMLHYTLCFLAGTSYINVMVHTSISRSVFYFCVYKGIDAKCGCQELQLKISMSLSKVHIAANAFKIF